MTEACRTWLSSAASLAAGWFIKLTSSLMGAPLLDAGFGRTEIAWDHRATVLDAIFWLRDWSIRGCR